MKILTNKEVSMRGFGDFNRWEAQIDGTDNQPSPEERRYLDSLPPARAGRWHIDENFRNQRQTDPTTSLDYAQAVQAFAGLLDREARLSELLACQTELDKRAGDIRGRRVWLSLHDGSISGSVGGYTIMADYALIALRLNERNYGVSLRAGVDQETGRRLAESAYVPVTAIKALALITKTA